jgi:hypothetical protein
MSKQQTSTKSKFASAFVLLAALLLTVGFGVLMFQQDWASTRIADLPPFFWILYVANIGFYLFAILIVKYVIKPAATATHATNPILSIYYVIAGTFQFVQMLIAPDPKGSLILLGTVGIVLIIMYGRELIRFIRTRFSPQRAARNQ